MAILKRGSGVWRVSRENNSCSDEDNRPYDEEADSSDSCKGSDVGEIGSELCRVGEHRCNIPYEIFDLPDLRPILSLDTWNYWLTDEERFSLSAYLPDMDQQTFMHTLKQLLAGENFHFGSPLFYLFDMLKGGLCQPEVSRYREGLEYLQKKEHYHFLRKYQNSMVKNLLEMRETWEHCRNLGVEERLHMRSSWKNLKGLAQPESHSLSQRHSEQMLETLQKGRPEKPSARSSRRQNLAKDVNMLEMDPSLVKGKGQLHSHLLGLEGIEKLGKRTPKGILKMAPKCGLRKNGQTEMHLESDQETPFAEMQNLKTKYKSSSALPHTSEWEVDDLVEETPFTMRKTRSRTRINGLEMTFNNMKEHRSWNYLNKNSGLVKSTLERCRKLGRVKEQEISERVCVQEAPKFGENIGRYKEGSNLAGGNKTLDNSKKNRERAKILAEYWRAQPQEMPRERASMISSKDLRKYPQERGMFDVSLYADGQGQKTDKKKRNPIDYHKKPTEHYRETFDQDISASEQPVLSFGHKMILDDKELDNKEQKIYENKKGKKECNKILEQLRKENMEINQSSKGFLRFTVKQKMPADEHKLERQSECLGSQSELVENRKYASGFNFPLDNSKRSHEGKKKKRKKRQIDEVMTIDLEKTQGESSSLDSPKESMRPPQGFEWAMKGTEKTETEETFPPQTEESEDMATSGDIDGKPISNVDITSFCHQWDEGTILQKKTEKNTEEDINVLNVGASNKSHGDAQSTLGKQAEEEKHLMNMVKRTSKEDADILTGVRESNGLQNSQLSQLEQVGGLKPWKKVGKKKLEDSKILDVMAEANQIQVSPGSTMYLDSDEFKATIRKAKKVKVDSETLDGMAESNVLHCDDYSSLCQQSDEGKPGKKRSRKKVDDTAGSLMSFPLKQASIADKVTLDAKASKKSSTLVVPPVVSSFAFSVIHFLSAVRTAMLSPSAEDISEVVNHSEKSDGERESSNQEGQFTISCDGKVEEQNFVIPNYPFDGQPDKCMGGSIASHLERERQAIPYSIPFQEIVKRVQMNPGDPCVLKIQEPLQDLVRGALKIFASKTAPQGVKGWKPLAVYDKSTRSWSWIGPVYSISPRHESLEVQTCSEAWGISQKMLLKLVEAFANWLKNGQETLQQIVLLPSPPPPSMLTCLDEKERFRDLRAQKSSITITPSSSVMRSYFRKEEVLRYSVPDRAFAYTAADGRKAVVAPLRRCGGKPTSKARDHFMLKPDRPPHVTILCLVRDAAARLPGSIGTRADVCTLIRDSQYIVEDVSDAQVNQVVSGALDRLHYERDPCVQFDGERKLWVYLHTERDEEDFEDDGTSSTKRWKRQKKEHFDNSDLGPCNDSPYHCRDDQDACGSGLGFDFCSPDYNGDSSSIYSGGKAELVYNRNGSLTSPRVLRSFNGSNIEDGMVPFIELPPSIHSIPGSMRESHLMGWEVLGLNPSGHGSNLQSQEHVSNGDFDNNTFSKERPTELLSSRLL